MAVISGCVILCDRVMREDDGVISLIRLVDLFILNPFPADVPPERFPVQIHALVAARFTADDTDSHTCEVALMRADNSRTQLYKSPEPFTLEENINRAPRGFNLNLTADIPATQLGTHFIVLEIDGQEHYRAVLTVVPPRG
jgi:hypothetical protein